MSSVEQSQQSKWRSYLLVAAQIATIIGGLAATLSFWLTFLNKW
jgi:hypothetical protein